MRKSMITVGIVTLGIGIVAGFALDSESMSEPAQTTIVVQQPTGFVFDSESTPAPVQPTVVERPAILNAVNLMKPDFEGQTSDAERKLHSQLTDEGYYYWVTHLDGIERINYDFTEKGKASSVEFEIDPDGVHMVASRYGVSTGAWGVWCSAPIGRSPVDAMNSLMAKTHSAASELNADPSCTYRKPIK